MNSALAAVPDTADVCLADGRIEGTTEEDSFVASFDSDRMRDQRTMGENPRCGRPGRRSRIEAPYRLV